MGAILQEVFMATGTLIVLGVIVGMFALFGLALGLAQINTRGIVAPGARAID